MGATLSLRTDHATQGTPAGLSCGMLASHPAQALWHGHGVGSRWARVLRGCFFLLWARAPPSPGSLMSLPLPPPHASCRWWSDQGPPGLFTQKCVLSTGFRSQGGLPLGSWPRQSGAQLTWPCAPGGLCRPSGTGLGLGTGPDAASADELLSPESPVFMGTRGLVRESHSGSPGLHLAACCLRGSGFGEQPLLPSYTGCVQDLVVMLQLEEGTPGPSTQSAGLAGPRPAPLSAPPGPHGAETKVRSAGSLAKGPRAALPWSPALIVLRRHESFKSAFSPKCVLLLSCN